MKIDRRTFVRKTLGAGVLALGMGPLLASCAGARRASFTPPAFPMEEIRELDDQSVAVLFYASLAPSGHNSQPWFVKRTARFEWVVGADPARRLPAVDPENRELLLSLGAFVENLSLAAGVYGYELQVKILAAKPTEEQILRVFLKREKVREYPLTRIAARRTVRKGFKPAEIRKNDIAKLEKPLEGNFFYFPRGSEHAKCLSEWAVESFRDQTNRDGAQRELASWIRFGDREAEKFRDGLTPEGMEITGISGWWVRKFYGPKDVLQEGFRRRGIDETARLAGEGGGWAIVTGSGETVADLIETGRRFERMFLLARELKIAIHPMTQMLEEEKWRNEIGKQHGPKMVPQFVLRVGYLDRYPDPVSLRRPVSWFLRV
jgi:hypothetical protein